MNRTTTLATAIAALIAATGHANAAIVAMDQTFGPLGGDALVLENGQWVQGFDGLNGGGDFGISPSGTAIWIKETWAGNPGSVVDLDTFVEPDPNLDATFPIDLNKQVTNVSDFFWDAFEIRIIPTGGVVSNVNASPNVHFDSVIITPDGDDFVIRFEQGGGFGGVIGKDIMFQFSFDYEGDIAEGLNFRILQTAIPTPGTIGVIALAGFAAARRRR